MALLSDDLHQLLEILELSVGDKLSIGSEVSARLATQVDAMRTKALMLEAAMAPPKRPKPAVRPAPALGENVLESTGTR